MQRLKMALVALAERLVYQRSVLLSFGILSPQLNQAPRNAAGIIIWSSAPISSTLTS
jgi:hypothetical protein